MYDGNEVWLIVSLFQMEWSFFSWFIFEVIAFLQIEHSSGNMRVLHKENKNKYWILFRERYVSST